MSQHLDREGQGKMEARRFMGCEGPQIVDETRVCHEDNVILVQRGYSKIVMRRSINIIEEKVESRHP